MKLLILPALLAAATSVLTACGGGGSAPATATPAASAPVALRIVATPNPNVFPLLLAMARQPSLPVTLVPIADGAQIDTTFAAGQGDALLAMNYTTAKKVITGKVPDLQLLRVNLWRGFSELTVSGAAVTNFSQLVGKGLLVSAPLRVAKAAGRT